MSAAHAEIRSATFDTTCASASTRAVCTSPMVLSASLQRALLKYTPRCVRNRNCSPQVADIHSINVASSPVSCCCCSELIGIARRNPICGEYNAWSFVIHGAPRSSCSSVFANWSRKPGSSARIRRSLSVVLSTPGSTTTRLLARVSAMSTTLSSNAAVRATPCASIACQSRNNGAVTPSAKCSVSTVRSCFAAAMPASRRLHSRQLTEAHRCRNVLPKRVSAAVVLIKALSLRTASARVGWLSCSTASCRAEMTGNERDGRRNHWRSKALPLTLLERSRSMPYRLNPSFARPLPCTTGCCSAANTPRAASVSSSMVIHSSLDNKGT